LEKNVFRPTVKPKLKPENKFGSNVRFGPVRQRRNTFFPETHFFQRLDFIYVRLKN
jgi:hypothetical protein